MSIFGGAWLAAKTIKGYEENAANWLLEQQEALVEHNIGIDRVTALAQVAAMGHLPDNQILTALRAYTMRKGWEVDFTELSFRRTTLSVASEGAVSAWVRADQASRSPPTTVHRWRSCSRC